jgi:hypothetical protein
VSKKSNKLNHSFISTNICEVPAIFWSLLSSRGFRNERIIGPIFEEFMVQRGLENRQLISTVW